VVDHYVRTTGDASVLDESVPFLRMRPLEPHEHEVYDLPEVTEEHASVYEHCLRALRRACTTGPHGLPLIGTGDWNDGMNRVGEHGRGESVWLGWFLHATLTAFSPLAREWGALTLASNWLEAAAKLRSALEQHAWDGEWYRRGFFDDGTPLGSAANDECRIDAIAQSWSVISGAANPTRAARAMESLQTHLLKSDPPLALLFTPPFEKSLQEPGYVKAYPRGVRENGGQYTHAAVWTLIALTLQGKADRAMEVFSMLNPIRRSMTRADVQRYKVEPYAVAADVYGEAPHEGRGGWTWYTGSAGWLYRAGLEWILGFRLRENQLVLAPCVPSSWSGFTIHYKHRGTPYVITVDQQPDPTALQQLTVDGQVHKPGRNTVELVADGATHSVHVAWLTASASQAATASNV
jgi:cyclic beta-1,2-glucan synthetase